MDSVVALRGEGVAVTRGWINSEAAALFTVCACMSVYTIYILIYIFTR